MQWHCRGWATAIAAVAIATMACGSGAARRFAGHWKGVMAEGVAGPAEMAANAYASGLELFVRGDTISVTTRKEKQTGRFKILKEYSMSLTIATDRDGTDAPQTFVFTDDKTMKWLVLDGQAIVLTKR